MITAYALSLICEMAAFLILEMEDWTLGIYVCTHVYMHSIRIKVTIFYIIHHILNETSQEAEMAFWEHILSSLLSFINDTHRLVKGTHSQTWLNWILDSLSESYLNVGKTLPWCMLFFIFVHTFIVINSRFMNWYRVQKFLKPRKFVHVFYNSFFTWI